MKKPITNYYNACQAVADLFIKTYYDNEAESWWVGDDVGGVFYVNENFYSVDNMTDYLKYDYSEKQMFDYYYYALNEHEHNKTPINIQNWKKSNKKK